MNEISLPYHLIVPGLISILILGIIIFKRKALFANRKRKWFWISVSIFFGIYLLIVGGSTFVDISAELALQKFDLNGDGFFSREEITPEQEEAMHKVISDTARNFSFVSGLIFSGIIAFFVFIFGRLIEYLNGKRIKNKQANA